MPTGRIMKLLNEHCRITGRNLDQMKEFYKGLNRPQRENFCKTTRFVNANFLKTKKEADAKLAGSLV